LRMMEIGSVQGGRLLVQLFLTKGNCMLVAPVSEFTMNPFKFPEDTLGKFVLAEPAMLGYPPLQLASPGTVPAPVPSLRAAGLHAIVMAAAIAHTRRVGAKR